LSAKLNPTVVKPIVINTAKPDEKNAYTAAYLAFKSSRFEESTAGFRMVVEKYPEGEYTDQAYYWLGESLQAQRQNEAAVQAFKHVIDTFKNSTKHAAALLKLAALYVQLDKKGDAKATLERVIKEHRNTADAEYARGQLVALSQTAGVKNKQ